MYLPDYRFPEHGSADQELSHFYTQNSQFSWVHSRALFCFLRFWKPKRVVEVGSGYSSLLMAEIKKTYLPDMTLQCVEPFPRPFLRQKGMGFELLEKRVQDMPIGFFESLESGDLLFIDSSHVCKTGSDVNYLFLKVLPRLRLGVKVHTHDVFLPFEYLREWVIDENRSWNEQYLLQALLMHSVGFKVVFGNCFAFWKFPQQISEALNLPSAQGFGGSSFYIERI